LNNLAWVLSEEKHEPSEALTHIDHLVEQTGRNAQALDTRGVILSRLGRHEDAIQDLEESNRLNPLPQTEFHLANTYRAAGREVEFRNYRDRIRKAGLKPEQLDPSERATLETMLKP
jgi:tetratricopeptide (TPR) repeat protein